ncbi:50S ribosomal protein L10 [Candidatus Berkelbacteria bacterium]|nr:50S ribosomal protein L10 [Candidatus Berkelbacteria bacterium]
MLTKAQKIELVNKLSDELKGQESWYFVGFAGLKFTELNELRRLLAEKGSRLKVIKTRLLAKALEKIGKVFPDELLDQPIALLTTEDYLSSAKILKVFTKDHPNLAIYGGYVEGDNVDQAKIAVFAALPSADELKAKLVGTLNAPMSRFVNALRWNGYALTSVLRQYLAKLT